MYYPYPDQIEYISDNVDQLDDLSPDELKSAKEALDLRRQSWKLIHDAEYPDKYLSLYPPEQNDKKPFFHKLHTLEKAREKLFSFKDGFFGKIITEFREEKLDIFISGSSSLMAVLEDGTHEPSDLDMYIKNINIEQLIKIEKVINKLKNPNQKIIVIRRPITIAWWIINSDDTIANQIQLNSLDNNSWIKIFEEYHANLVCIGYHILSDNFLFHSMRWREFINNNGINWFSNIYSTDIMFTLIHATNKYYKRGFNVKALIRSSDDKFTIGKIDTLNELNEESKYAIDRLVSFRWGRNLVISDTVKKIFFKDENPPPISELVNIYKLHYDYYFQPHALNLKKNDGLSVIISPCNHEILLEKLMSYNTKTRVCICPTCHYRYQDAKFKKIDKEIEII
jgi:hypothetical protein